MSAENRHYIFNLETTKIELHFDKAEYDALSDAQKQEIKSAFLWSNRGKCWVSRAKEPNLWRAKQVASKQVASKLGFTAEQREGERLTFAEQLERQAERAEARAERYEQYAENAEKRGDQLQKPLQSMHGDIAFLRSQTSIAPLAGPLPITASGFMPGTPGALKNTAKAAISKTGRKRRGEPQRRRNTATRPILTAGLRSAGKKSGTGGKTLTAMRRP